MKFTFKYLTAVVSMFSLILMSSCGGDDAVPKSGIEFDQDQHDGNGALNAYESDGKVDSFHPLLWSDESTGVQYEITINLTRPVAETTILRFSTSGSADRSTALVVGDYDIETDGELLVIEKGQSSAALLVNIYEDWDFDIEDPNNLDEPWEKFTIELEEVVSGPGIIGENNTFDVYIYEDDLIAYVDWVAQDGKTDTDIDMILWIDGDYAWRSNYSDQSNPYEFINVPGGLFNGEYGFSYTFKSGTSTDLDVNVILENFGGNLNGTSGQKTYSTHYDQSNVNAYEDSGIDPWIAQTMDKQVMNYINLLPISKNPDGGSRVGSSFNLKIDPRYKIKPIDKKIILGFKKAKGI